MWHFPRILSLLFFLFAALITLPISIQLVIAQSEINKRIINGSPSAEGAWPWVVSLFTKNGDPANPSSGHFCGGALIAPQYVLTAAHCVDNKSPDKLEVVIGRTKLSSNSGIRSLVSGVIVHPKWDVNSVRFDFALLKLNQPVNSAVLPLVGPGDEALWQPGSAQAKILGWGYISSFNSIIPDNLQEANIPIVSDQICLDTLGINFSAASMICGGTLSTPGKVNGVDSCNGDSGGPLIVPDGTSYKLAGLTSWGYECASDTYYGAYSRIASARDWILSFPPVPPKNLIYPYIIGNPLVGETLTCNPGTWAGDDLKFEYRWFRVLSNTQYTEILGETGQQYKVSDLDEELYLFCDVKATNSSGVVYDYSDDFGPIDSINQFIATPTPFPTTTPDYTPPLASIAGVKCKKKHCDITMNVSDSTPSSGVKRVDVLSFFDGQICKAVKSKKRASNNSNKKIKTKCKSIELTTSYDALIQPEGAWLLSLDLPGSGSLRLFIRAEDQSGNIQATPVTKKIKVK